MGVQVNSYFKSKYTGAQIENMLDAFGNTAAAYETSTAYSVGDLVLYNNALYVCTGATTGAFDPTKWQQTTLAELVENLGATYTDPNNDGHVVVGVDSTVGEKILRSLTFPGLTNRYYLPFAQYIRTAASNDPDNASFSVEIPDAEEAPMHSTKIKGKTVAVNQLVQNGNFADGTNHWSTVGGVTTSVSNNVVTLTASAVSSFYNSIPSIISGHTYFMRAKISSTDKVTVGLYKNSGGFSLLVNDEAVATSTVFESIFTRNDVLSTDTFDFRVRINTANGTTVTATNVNLKDLTADGYTSTETTDVATFKAAFLKKNGYPLPLYIPYNAGSLANVDGTYRLRGRNLWDEQWEAGDLNGTTGQPQTSSTYIRSKNFCKCKANESIYVRATDNAYVFWYDANQNFISHTSTVQNSIVTSPSNAVYFKLTNKSTAYNYNITLNESDASINGTYISSYNGGTIDCSGAPLNGFDDTVCDVKDFATGERTTKCATVNLGDLTWTYSSANNYFYANMPADSASPVSGYGIDSICGRYKREKYPDFTSSDKAYICNSTGMSNSKYIYIKDSAYSDAATFKTAMNGVYLCYELATPVVSTETPQPVYTDYGYNVLEPVSGGVQSAEVDTIFYENIAGYIDKRLNGG